MLIYEKAKPLTGIDLNYEVVGGTTAPTAFKEENTIWVNTSTPITEYAFGYTNPWVDYKDIDYIPNSIIIQDKYLGSSGGVTAGDGSNAPCYTENYIPVEYGKTYNINYELSASKSMWFAICEYTGVEGSYTFKTRNVVVNSVTGTSQSLTYTPSATTVTAVRLSWRTFYPSGTTYTVSFIKPDIEFNTAVIGDTWIKTDIDKAPASFNAIKRNELMVYPYKLKQWNGNRWKTMGGSLYQNDTAMLIYNLQTPDLPYVLKNGLKEQEDITGGWKIDKQGSNDKWYFFGYDESTQSIRFAQRNMTSCRYGWVATNNKVNVSGWNKLVMRVSTYQGYGDADKCNGWVYVCLSNTQNAPMTSDDVLTADVVKGTYYYSTNSSKTEHIVEVDISGIDGEFYIVAGQRNKTSQKTFHCQIHDIYFED